MAGEDFTLKGKVVLDTTGLAQPTEDTKGLTSEFTNLFGGLSSTTVAMGATAAAAAGLAIAINTLTEDAYEAYCEFDRLGWTIGISAAEMAKWNQVAIYSDSTGSSLVTMLGKMSINLADTGMAGDKARQIFTDMGIAVYGADGQIRPLTELFPEFIDGINRMSNTAERNGAAMDIMGRGYRELAGYAILGADGIRQVYEETGALTQKQQDDLGALEETWKNLNRTMEENKMILGAELAPAVWEVVDAVQTLMSIDDGKFFKDMVAGIELAVDAFKILVRGLTLTIIALEYIQALTKGDFAGAEAIRQKGADYVEKYVAADKEDDFNTAWSNAGGKNARPTGDVKLTDLNAKAAETKYGSAAYTDAEIGAMATRLGVPVDEVKARLDKAGEANKYGVSTSQLSKSMPIDSSNEALRLELEKSFQGSADISGTSSGMKYAQVGAAFALARASTDTTDSNLNQIRSIFGEASRIDAGFNGSATWENTSSNQSIADRTLNALAAYMASISTSGSAVAPVVNVINYNYGSSSPEEIANATAEATSRELARQAAL